MTIYQKKKAINRLADQLNKECAILAPYLIQQTKEQIEQLQEEINDEIAKREQEADDFVHLGRQPLTFAASVVSNPFNRATESQFNYLHSFSANFSGKEYHVFAKHFTKEEASDAIDKAKEGERIVFVYP